jgi:hypothetical protein
LSICYTKVTDSGLKELAGMKCLQRLDILDVKNLTAAGVAELQKALPECKIDHNVK